MYYEDDNFHPTQKNDLDEPNTTNKNKKNFLGDMKEMDKGYHKITKQIILQGEVKNKQIELYVSGDNGSYIRNAITGHRTPFLVGSKQEDLFFKVGMPAGKIRYNGSGSLFYETPEQFEKHQYVVLKPAIKEKWYEKNVECRSTLSKS